QRVSAGLPSLSCVFEFGLFGGWSACHGSWWTESDGVVPQRGPCLYPRPVRWKVQDGSALWAGQSGRDVDDAPPQRRSSREGVGCTGEHAGSAQQVARAVPGRTMELPLLGL